MAENLDQHLQSCVNWSNLKVCCCWGNQKAKRATRKCYWQADFDSMVWIQAVAFYIAYLDGLHVKFIVLQLLSTLYHSMCIVSICWWPCWEACFHCFCKASGAQQKSFYFSWLKWSGSHGCLRAMFLLMCSWKPRGRRRPTCESN